MAYQARDSTDLRGLKALVVFLGVLIVIGTTVVVGVIIKRIYATPRAASISAPRAASISAPRAASISAPATALVNEAVPGLAVPFTVLAPGEHIAGIAGAGGEFAVWVSGPAGDRLLLLNPQTGVLSTVLAPPK